MKWNIPLVSPKTDEACPNFLADVGANAQLMGLLVRLGKDVMPRRRGSPCNAKPTCGRSQYAHSMRARDSRKKVGIVENWT